MRTLVLLALMLLAVVPAHADLLYTYTGLNFSMVTGNYTPADHISGWFILDSAFVPVDGGGNVGWTNPNSIITPGVLNYSFTDGHQTLTPANSTTNSGGFLLAPPEREPIPGARKGAEYGVELSGLDGSHLVTRFTGSGESVDSAISPSGSGTCWPNPAAFGCQAVVDDHVPGGLRWWGTWTVQTVSVPELAILPRLPRVLKFGLGLGIEARVTNALQRATAWLAAAILRAPRDGVTIRMPHVAVEVAEACSGLQTLLLMLAAAALIAAVIPKDKILLLVGLILAAVLLALEANALRVAWIAIGLEHLGAFSREAKDWIQVGTTGIALGQLVGIGRLITSSGRHSRLAQDCP